jgi:hypothetical protein
VFAHNAEAVSAREMAQPVVVDLVFTAVDADEPPPVAPPGAQLAPPALIPSGPYRREEHGVVPEGITLRASGGFR